MLLSATSHAFVLLLSLSSISLLVGGANWVISETGKYKKEERIASNVKMGRCRSWLSFKTSFLFPTKDMILKISSRLGHKTRGNGHGLVSLYEDMEACGGYADIRVMWKMVHSSSPQIGHMSKSHKKPAYWRFCFRPT